MCSREGSGEGAEGGPGRGVVAWSVGGAGVRWGWGGVGGVGTGEGRACGVAWVAWLLGLGLRATREGVGVVHTTSEF